MASIFEEREQRKMAYDNTNSGILARNDNRKSDKHPEYTGSLNVDGVDYWVSAWVNEGRPGSKMEGKKYFSLKINPKEKKAEPMQYDKPFEGDDIPF